MINLSNRYALITGASGCIGSSIALLLNKLNCHVIISGTNKDKLEELGKQMCGNYTIKICDLKDPQMCVKLVSDLNHLDIIVCNAGITNDSLAIRMKDEAFKENLQVNLVSNFILNREALKIMLKNRYGRVINISSIVAITGNHGQSNYAASKAALIAMTKSLALEVASKNITVNAVAPGFIKSPMTDKIHHVKKEEFLKKIPALRFGNAIDIAYSVAFLASEEASYITGQTIHVNGGMLMI